MLAGNPPSAVFGL